MARKSINYYGLTVNRLLQWQFDYLVKALRPDFEAYAEGTDISKKIRLYLEHEALWTSLMDPEKTNPVTREENEAIEDIRSNFKICHTTIEQKRRREKDAATQKQLTNVEEQVEDYKMLGNNKTAKPLMAQKAELFLAMMKKQSKAVMQLLNIDPELKLMAEALATYKQERKKRDKIVDDTRGKLTKEWPVMASITESLLKAVDNMNDPDKGEDGKDVYPYNTLISTISSRFLQLKRRIEKSKSSDADDSKSSKNKE